MFDSFAEEARALLDDPSLASRARIVRCDGAAHPWPREECQIILKDDAAVEVGPPGEASVSLLVTCGGSSFVQDGRMSLIGPDLPDCVGREIPFGKVVLVSGHGFDDGNFFERHQEMFLQRFSLDLDGYSPRAVPQANKEWSRVSRKAVADGFTFEVLARELYRELHALPYVDAVEIAFITSSTGDVNRFRSLAERSSKAFSALNKMAEHLAYDCKSCEFKDVCDEVDDVRRMHRNSMR
jgi:CO dehydrogenase/acetyl-CoA synthase beta subunit